MAKENIEPNVILTLTTNNIMNVPVIITDFTGQVLKATHIDRICNNYHTLRLKLKSEIEDCIKKYGVDTILIEQSQLFIDKMDRYPDPLVLRDVQLGFGIRVMIEDNFWNTVKYILEIPKYEWKNAVLNSKVDYAIDLYKNHILKRQNIDEETMKIYDSNNYYEALCFSESVLYSRFLKEKYKVNAE